MRRRLCLALSVLLLLIMVCTPAASSPPPCTCGTEDRVLKLTTPAMKGDDVEELQWTLKELGFFHAEITGVFGKVTENAVKEFQKWAGLEAVGEVGPKTRNALTKAIAQQSLAGVLEPLTPPPGEMRLVVDVDKRTLTVIIDDKPWKSFPCAVGKPTTKSPVGDWAVVYKGTNWGGGFGTRWMGLNVPWGIYGIHGTNKPGSIGTAASGGCIRMFNRDIERLYPIVKVGTRVSIVGTYPKIAVNQPLSRGRSGKEVQQVQISLRDAGFMPGYTDGRFGLDTENAIKTMQQFYGLPQTGKADYNILTLLRLRR